MISLVTLVQISPIRGPRCPEVSRKFGFPDYVKMSQEGGKVVSLMHRPLLPQKIILVLIAVRGWVDPRTIVRSEGLCQWKIPMTPTGIEPATFRFVAQNLNHCATAVPPVTLVGECKLWTSLLCDFLECLLLSPTQKCSITDDTPHPSRCNFQQQNFQ